MLVRIDLERKSVPISMMQSCAYSFMTSVSMRRRGEDIVLFLVMLLLELLFLIPLSGFLLLQSGLSVLSVVVF